MNDRKSRVAEAERREAEAWAAYHRMAADRAEVEWLRRHVRALETSPSWRITAPLRLLARSLRWLRPRVLARARRAAASVRRS